MLQYNINLCPDSPFTIREMGKSQEITFLKKIDWPAHNNNIYLILQITHLRACQAHILPFRFFSHKTVEKKMCLLYGQRIKEMSAVREARSVSISNRIIREYVWGRAGSTKVWLFHVVRLTLITAAFGRRCYAQSLRDLSTMIRNLVYHQHAIFNTWDAY